jgi:transcriptional regulator with XRE-family HTH domain
MVERILEVLKVKQLSPSQFADEIGVQRSNISHLISGRNKPSLEFIQKIIKRFTDINPEYLLSGQGSIFREGSKTVLEFAGLPTLSPENQQVTPLVIEDEKVETSKNSRKKVVANTDQHVDKAEKPVKNDKVEKIVYFFKDKTFKEYFPE